MKYKCNDTMTGICLQGDRCCNGCPYANKWDCNWVCNKHDMDCEFREEEHGSDE